MLEVEQTNKINGRPLVTAGAGALSGATNWPRTTFFRGTSVVFPAVKLLCIYHFREDFVCKRMYNSKSALVRYGLCLAGVWKVGPNLAPTTSILPCLLLQSPTPFPAVAHGPLVPDIVLGYSSCVDFVLAAVASHSTLKHRYSQPRTVDYGRSHAPVLHVSPEPHSQLSPTVPDPPTATTVSTTRPTDDFGAL